MDPLKIRPDRLTLIALLLALSVSAAAQLTITPTTTLTAETANNTGASNSFSGLPNGVPPSGNVSKVPTVSLLYPGSATKIYAHYMGWFGAKDHVDIGYRSDDKRQIRRQVDDMVSRGLSGVIASWDDHSMVTRSVPLLLSEVEAHPGFEFAIELENQSLKHYAKAHGNDVTPQVINDLTRAASIFENSASYMRINGRPVVFFFGGGDYFIDWDRVRAAVPGNPWLIFRNATAFDKPYSDGAFAWTAQKSPNDEMLSYLDGFYSKAKRSKGIVFGSAWAGFNDNVAAWGKNRVTSRNCGQTWLDTFAEAGKHYSSKNQLAAMRIVTWNDYEEGSAIEPGIDNCLSVSASVNRDKLKWSASGNEETVYAYTVFISTDGERLMELQTLSAKNHSLDLSKTRLGPGNYTLYVKAVGKPSIQNKMSNPVRYQVDEKTRD